MKRFCLLLLYVFVMLESIMAQELKVKSFSLAINDLSASVDIVPDENGEPCALVKILLVDSIAKVEGFVLKTKSVSPTENWAYLSSGAKEVRIMPTHYKPISIYFPDFGVKGVEGKRTYILDLEGSNLVSTPILISSRNVKPISSTPSGSVIIIPVKKGISIEMVKVEAGSFMMGTPREKQPVNTFIAENPVHHVTLTNNYYLGKYEVTQELWQSVMGNNPSAIKGSNMPVEHVSWKDCQDFISRLNSLTGKNFRLPTEAEWEYAARGANMTHGYQYSGSDTLDVVAWYHGNSGGNPHVVGTKQPNELGIYDMSGNVWEWCQDWTSSYIGCSEKDPVGESFHTNHHINRGGSVETVARTCRSSHRNDCAWDSSGDPFSLGLRLALSE